MPTLKEYIELARSAKDDVRIIYEAIEEEVNDDATLANLETVSKTSVEGLWIFVYAFMSWFFQEFVLAPFKIEIQNAIDNNVNPNDRWWAAEVKKFQDGDPLLFDETTKRYYYETIDPFKQIVKFVAIVNQAGLCTIKVAKANKEPLTSDELDRLRVFRSEVQPSGANIEEISIESDKLKAPITVYYNALRTEAFIKPLVEEAITNYLDNLPFNGRFSLTKYKNAIEAVPDVFDIVRGVFEARPDEEVAFSVIEREYDPLAGHIQIDPAFPLDDMIVYIPVNG